MVFDTNDRFGSSTILESSTEISTGFICDNCHKSIDRIFWKRCKKCNVFDLCHICDKMPYETLPRKTQDHHKSLHQPLNLNEATNGVSMDFVKYKDAMTLREENFGPTIKSCLKRIWKNKKIENDYQMGYVIDQLKEFSIEVNSSSQSSEEPTKSELLQLIGKYHTHGYQTDVKILSLDGGGTRGHMSIQILCELINDIYIKPSTNSQSTKSFIDAQKEFTDQFDYLVGTSTGGLIAFCLAVKHDLSDIKEIYEDAARYFKKQGYTSYAVAFYDKYDPTPIYKKIDEIIGKIQVNGKQLTAENATLFDIHNLLNPNCQLNDDTSEWHRQCHSNRLEFTDDETNPPHIKREKVLLITSYNTTKDCMMIFNTSYADHWGYRIADVLKATMAAPTYFRPCTMYKRKRVNGHLERDDIDEIFVDGGVFANNPELTALWTMRMEWKKPINCRLLSLGTGSYNAKVSVDNWKGGYRYWLIQTNGLLVNMFMDGTRSLTETVMGNLAQFGNINRMRFNYKLKESMELDDPNFAIMFNQEWKKLKHDYDYEVLIYFYQRYIQKTLEQ